MLPRIGILGATSFVGQSLVPLLQRSHEVIAFSSPLSVKRAGHCEQENIPNWISLLPIWVLVDRLEQLLPYQPKKIVALSSTSVFTKQSSADSAEQELAGRFLESEQRLKSWAELHGVEWMVLRPTLIYGRGRDRNVCEIARFIKRFGFFPVLGDALGLRQPIHVDDVAMVCSSAINTDGACNAAYNIAGAERLPYREMIERIFVALHRRARLIKIPRGLFFGAVTCARVLPRFRKWSVAMADRMNQDMVFDNARAVAKLGLKTRPFRLEQSDLPR